MNHQIIKGSNGYLHSKGSSNSTELTVMHLSLPGHCQEEWPKAPNFAARPSFFYKGPEGRAPNPSIKSLT